MSSKLGIDATKKLRGEDFKRPRSLIKMDEAVKSKGEKLLGNVTGEHF